MTLNAGGILTSIKGYLVRGFSAVGASFKAAYLSPTVWLAMVCTLVGGFWLGGKWHGHFSRPHVPAALIGVSPASQDTTAYEARATAAEAEAKQWKAEAATKQAEVAKLTAELGAKTDALTALQKRMAARVTVPKKPVSEPAKAAWTPFER